MQGIHSTANDLLDLLDLPDPLRIRSAQTVTPFVSGAILRANGDTKYTAYQWLLCITEFRKVRTPLMHVPATLSYLGCSQADSLLIRSAQTVPFSVQMETPSTQPISGFFASQSSAR